MRRNGQKWVTDSLVASLGFDLVFPDAYIGWLEQGMRLQDYRRTMSRVRTTAMMPKAWRATAEDLVEKAQESEKRGHSETALEFYHRAAFAYAKAFWADKSEATHAALRETYGKAATYAPYDVTRVEIPFEGHTIFGVLHVPRGVAEPVPCVLFVPGMDMVKEEYPGLQDNRFIKRNMACLSIDGPGQGESWLHGLTVDADNYARAGVAVIDFIEARPELDGKKVGIFGCSMGSYWAPTIAAADKRVMAVAGAMGCFMSKERIFNLAPPDFRRNFMMMSGVHDDAEFDEMASRMTLSRFADDITCPILLAQGEFDQLCTLADAQELFEMLRAPKELWVFENELHALGRQRGEMFSWVADWLRDKMNGNVDPDLAEEVWISSPD